MNEVGAITGHIDVAQVVLYAFWIFFFGLVVHLQREGRREGFPLVPDNLLEERARKGDDGLATPERKTYRTMFDGLVFIPARERADEHPIAAVAAFGAPGSPLVPTGNPLIDGVGPASFCLRVDIPERTVAGTDRIVPFRVSHEHFIAEEDADPRGMPVFAADGLHAGTVTDLWVDRSEGLVRYIELELSDRAVTTRTFDAAPKVQDRIVPEHEVDQGLQPVTIEHAPSEMVSPEMLQRRVLMPIGFCTIVGSRRRIESGTLTAAQFGDVPRIAHPSRITLAEEDRIVGYFGGGAMYATPLRSEPLL